MAFFENRFNRLNFRVSGGEETGLASRVALQLLRENWRELRNFHFSPVSTRSMQEAVRPVQNSGRLVHWRKGPCLSLYF